MCAVGAVRIAGGIDQRAAEGLGRNSDGEGQSLGGDNACGVPRIAAIEGAIKPNHIVMVVVPGDVQRPAGSHKGDGAN